MGLPRRCGCNNGSNPLLQVYGSTRIHIHFFPGWHGAGRQNCNRNCRVNRRRLNCYSENITDRSHTCSNHYDRCYCHPRRYTGNRGNERWRPIIHICHNCCALLLLHYFKNHQKKEKNHRVTSVQPGMLIESTTLKSYIWVRIGKEMNLNMT